MCLSDVAFRIYIVQNLVNMCQVCHDSDAFLLSSPFIYAPTLPTLSTLHLCNWQSACKQSRKEHTQTECAVETRRQWGEVAPPFSAAAEERQVASSKSQAPSQEADTIEAHPIETDTIMYLPGHCLHKTQGTKLGQ